MHQNFKVIAALCLLAEPVFADANDGVYKGPLVGPCRTGTVTLSVAGNNLIYRPGAGEEGTGTIQADGSFHLAMTSSARYAGSRITIDGKLAGGKLAGDYIATGSFTCSYTFSAERQPVGP